MRTSENDSLYRVVKNKICERIFRGEYADGENLPPERTLAESLGVSRVTVRKAMALLEGDGIIERVQGSGNRVNLSVAGYPGTTDIIAVLAHAQNVFFSSFIDHFQRIAERSDSLVLFKRSPPDELIEESLFKLLQKNIRNAVIWLEDQNINLELIRRLRGLGMNMVFFDVVLPSPYADGVLLDNNDAITALYLALKTRHTGPIGYVGWDRDAPLTASERESYFLRQEPEPIFLHKIPWSDRSSLSSTADRLSNDILTSGRRPKAILCGDGEIGVAIRKALNASGQQDIDVASPDEYSESVSLGITVYRQDFGKMAAATFQRVLDQNGQDWKSSVSRIRGELHVNYIGPVET